VTARQIRCAIVLLAGFQASAANYTLVTEPDQGFSAIYSLIGSARRTLDMTMYELSDAQAEQLLASAVQSGVAVRVTLDQNLEKSVNTPAYDYLGAHGVEVHWANPKYAATHQKTIVADGAVAAIMTLNLTSQYYSDTRDFAVIENDSDDIAAIEAAFAADFENSVVTPATGDDLVWSPTGSQAAIVNLIDSAKHSLLVENEEMGDATVVNALESAAQRGVLVQVVMTNTDNDYATEFGQLVAAGVQVATYASDAPLYIHAKVILADYGAAGAQALVGSQNFSNASLAENRELGLMISDAAVLESLDITLSSDFRGAVLWPGSKNASVVNAAGLQPGFASSGWLTIFGSNLAPVTDNWSKWIVNGALPQELDGVTVTVAGQPAYVAYISPTQINAIAPEVGGGAATVKVTGPGGASTTITAIAQPAQPAFFEWGTYAVATHQDYSLAAKSGTLSSPTVPAAPGETIILWGTGFGATQPAAPAGTETPAGATYSAASQVAVTIGGTQAIVYGAALAPGFAALYQVAIQIPETLADGDYAIVATISGAASPGAVLLTVQH
jgi:cardiolipin synthase A/B